MNWSMPRPVLQIVASVLGGVFLGSFALGILTAPSRARLPGERQGEAGAPLQATDATPLGDDRIEGPTPPPELSDEEKARLAAEKEDREAAALAKAEAAKAAAPLSVPPPAQAPPEKVEPAQPPPPKQPEEPPF